MVSADASGARILVVDNHSSFSFNLVQYLEEVTGVRPVVLQNDQLQEVRDCLAKGEVDGIVISPGPGTPERAEDLGVSGEVIAESTVPVLGVCLGHQAIGLLHGASIERCEEIFHGRTSEVVHQGDPLFAGIPQCFVAMRYHSLRLLEPLPSSLQVIARTRDGRAMAIRHRTRKLWGVQFHPESVGTPAGKQLLGNFASICAPGRPARSPARGSVPRHGEPKRFLHRVRVADLRRVDGAKAEEADVFETLFGQSKNRFLIAGANTRVSFMGDASGPESFVLRYSLADKMVQLSGGRNLQQGCESIISYMQTLQEELRCASFSEEGENNEVGWIPFFGGWVGYYGYELKAESGMSSPHVSRVPDAQWIWADRSVAYDRVTGEVELFAITCAETQDESTRRWFAETRESLGRCQPAGEIDLAPSMLRFVPDKDDSAYCQAVEAAKEELRAGESYELCLTTQWRAKAQLQPSALTLFRRLEIANPAPRSMLLQFEELAILSSSPECFLRCDADGRVESRPIKGTTPRGENKESDARLREELLSSEKDHAENRMIVDLVRNDLGKVCQAGSIQAQAAVVERHPSVHQLVGSVHGTLNSTSDAFDCVKALFPGGSMTGAPKKRSTEILDDLEGGARGPYAGCMGFFRADGAADLAIVIRTLVIEKEETSVGVGGAITVLSEAQKELMEAKWKGRALWSLFSSET